jgi:putative zinc finger/helix-turn-helix YgiT family protein
MAKATKCVACRRGRLVKATEPYTVRVGETRVEFREIPVRRCGSCGETYYDGAVMERVELQAADALARSGTHTPDSLRFMRKALGLRGQELAALLGTSPETISRWERGKMPIDRYALVVIGAVIQDEMAGRTTTRDLLKAGRSAPRRRIVARPLEHVGRAKFRHGGFTAAAPRKARLAP